MSPTINDEIIRILEESRKRKASHKRSSTPARARSVTPTSTASKRKPPSAKVRHIAAQDTSSDGAPVAFGNLTPGQIETIRTYHFVHHFGASDISKYAIHVPIDLIRQVIDNTSTDEVKGMVASSDAYGGLPSGLPSW